MSDNDVTVMFSSRGWTQLEPFVLSDGTRAMRWLCDPDGEGIGVAWTGRVGLDGVAFHLELLAGLHDRGQRLREIVVATDVSGSGRFHERPDLMAVAAEVLEENSWVRFVAFANHMSISMDFGGIVVFGEFLVENDVELVLINAGDEPIDLSGWLGDLKYIISTLSRSTS
jgi:hypothetical protein